MNLRGVTAVAGGALLLMTGALAGNNIGTNTVAATQIQECIQPAVRPALNVAVVDQPSGSDLNASNSSTPIIYWTSDGSQGHYNVQVDGGTVIAVVGDSFGNACLFSTTLPDGSHTLTGTETSPHAGNTIAPYTFTVDTVPPSPPSAPTLASYSDSCYASPPAGGCISTTQPGDVKGDNKTIYNNPALLGTTGPRQSVVLVENGSTIGGALADVNGNYTIRPQPLSVGTHSLSVVAFDGAGNASTPSGSLSLTILAPPGTTTTTTVAPTTTTSSTTTSTSTSTSTTTSTSTSTTTTTIALNHTPCTVQTAGTGFCTGTFSH